VVVALLGISRARRLAVVGHEPDLGEVAAFLAGAQRPLPFKKGGICRIDVLSKTQPAGGTLVWFAPPKLLRLAGRP
jgi:phosphohistidine phosphatase SixA